MLQNLPDHGKATKLTMKGACIRPCNRCKPLSVDRSKISRGKPNTPQQSTQKRCHKELLEKRQGTPPQKDLVVESLGFSLKVLWSSFCFFIFFPFSLPMKRLAKPNRCRASTRTARIGAKAARMIRVLRLARGPKRGGGDEERLVAVGSW